MTASSDLFKDVSPEGPKRVATATKKVADKPPRSVSGGAAADDVTLKDVNLVKQAKEKQHEAITNQIMRWGGMAQVGFIANQDLYCAKAIGDHVPAIATSLSIIAEDFPLVKQLLTASDRWGAMAILTWNVVQMGLTMAVHHDKVPYDGVIKWLVPIPPKAQTGIPPEILAQMQHSAATPA